MESPVYEDSSIGQTVSFEQVDCVRCCTKLDSSDPILVVIRKKGFILR